MITIENLHVEYKSGRTAHHAVRGVDLTIGRGEFFTLLGPSGCGKTTTLRAVAGLERAASGRISVGGRVVCDSRAGVFVEPNERNIGMVFQSYAIWPHMTVFENVAFPLRHLRPKPKEAVIRERVLQALALVKLGGLEARPAPFLSGGQQQRLALARALVFEPQALLLDEPLSNLDAKLREEMRHEISELVRRLQITTLFVTHEQVEALTMSDRIGLMRDGLLIQQGSPNEIYNAPADRFSAEFVGRMNFLAGRIGQPGPHEGASVRVETDVGGLEVARAAQVSGQLEVLLAFRPEDVRVIASREAGGPNSFSGIVEDAAMLGSIGESRVRINGAMVRVQTHPRDMPARGSTVTMEVNANDIRIITP